MKLEGARMAARLVRDLHGFLRRPHAADSCGQLLTDRLATRGEAFIDLLGRAVFERPGSPYLALMRHAGIEHGDVAGWIRREGVDAAVRRLHRAGVYVTLDEFKGRQPIRRGALELPVRERDFDNPLISGHYESRTGGSRRPGGIGGRLMIDLDGLADESLYDLAFHSALGIRAWPMGVWRPVPPASAGIRTLLRHAKIGIFPKRWFSQSELRLARGNVRYYSLTRYVVGYSRLCGRPLPAPEHMPLEEAGRVARWLAAETAKAHGVYFEAPASTAVRVCAAAKEAGVEIAGTIFRLGGEALTEARARIFAEAGARAFCHYTMSEAGRMAVACTAPQAIDDVHVAVDRVLLLHPEAATGPRVPADALFCSTLRPTVPKLLINVETGDSGVLEERACGCPLDAMGFRRHLHRIRSYEKLTSEGMTFSAVDLLRLVEEVLPARFGGQATDYQIVEEAEDGLTKVSILVSPRVGDVDAAAVAAAFLAALGSRQWLVAGYWRDAGAVRVLRREPYTTAAAKILPLHVIQPSS